VEQEAEGRENSAILTAEAQRQTTIAAAIQARGQAEAAPMDSRSEAFADYGQAAILDLLVKVLPEVVAAASAPLAGLDEMTVISADGDGALGRSVAADVAQGLQLSGDLTGLDVGAMLRRLARARRTTSRPPPPSPGCSWTATGRRRTAPDVPAGTPRPPSPGLTCGSVVPPP
jgi:flotillin